MKETERELCRLVEPHIAYFTLFNTLHFYVYEFIYFEIGTDDMGLKNRRVFVMKNFA